MLHKHILSDIHEQYQELQALRIKLVSLPFTTILNKVRRDITVDKIRYVKSYIRELQADASLAYANENNLKQG